MSRVRVTFLHWVQEDVLKGNALYKSRFTKPHGLWFGDFGLQEGELPLLGSDK